jgi:hypothetical protein
MQHIIRVAETRLKLLGEDDFIANMQLFLELNSASSQLFSCIL